MSDELLRNILMSSNPCPICEEAAEQDPMTYEDWAASRYGLPGSSARYCEDDCHCVLLPDGMVDQFPSVAEHIRLRGEKGSDLITVVDIGPREMGLKAAMEEWNATHGNLPNEIYDMNLEDIEKYLRKLMRDRS